MRTRYKPIGNWFPRRRSDWLHNNSPFADHVRIEVSDVQEVGGHRWTAGAHRVIIRIPEGMERPARGGRSKTFIGEMAWADAERYANDAIKNFNRQYIGGRGRVA